MQQPSTARARRPTALTREVTPATSVWQSPLVHVDVSCRKCGQRRRLDLGDPAAQPVEEHLRLVVERLSHQPSFECFGGHLELAPPLPRFWHIHWETYGP